MSEENKQEEILDKGPRGEVGQASAGLTIRQKWHEAHFIRENNHDRAHPHRQMWVPQKGAPSLKQFARKLAKEGDAVAKTWFANKQGKNNQKRSEENATKAKLAASATRVARQKKKNQGGGGGGK